MATTNRATVHCYDILLTSCWYRNRSCKLYTGEEQTTAIFVGRQPVSHTTDARIHSATWRQTMEYFTSINLQLIQYCNRRWCSTVVYLLHVSVLHITMATQWCVGSDILLMFIEAGHFCSCSSYHRCINQWMSTDELNESFVRFIQIELWNLLAFIINLLRWSSGFRGW